MNLMRKVVCLLQGHNWSRWYKSAYNMEKWRTCYRCNKLEAVGIGRGRRRKVE